MVTPTPRANDAPDPSVDLELHVDRRRGALAVAAFLVMAAALSCRAIVLADFPRGPAAWVLEDFRNAVYYPVVAWLDGANPYDVGHELATYPVTMKFALYSPLTLLMHLPFGLVPFRAAAVVYYAFTLALVPVLARVVLQATGTRLTTSRVFGLSALILASRPGHMNLLAGQVTLQVVIGCCLALCFARRRPGVGALGLAVSTLKPTFGVPLALLMLCRGAFRATAIGVAIAALASVAVTLTLIHAAGGLVPFFDAVRANYEGSMLGTSAHPALSVTRIDAVALVSRFLGHSLPGAASLGISLGILGLGGLAIWFVSRRADRERTQPLTVTLACVSVLACTYHQAYDLLLLTLPLSMLVIRGPGAGTPALRWTLCGLLALPVINYLATDHAVERLGLAGDSWIAVASINGGALMLAFVLCVWVALRGDW